MNFQAIAILLAVALACSNASAQEGGPAFPLLAGGQAELGWGDLPPADEGSALVRVVPFVGWWVRGLGFVRIGFASVSHTTTDTSGTSEIVQRAYQAQAGASLGGPMAPYLFGGYTRAQRLATFGDAAWNEYGVGLGTLLPLGPWAGILCEVEHRWLGERTLEDGESVASGTRLQLNLGFSIYLH